MSGKENLIFVINANYIGQFKITFRSVADCHPGIGFRLHMLISRLTPEQCADITRYVEALGSDVTFYKIDDSLFEGLPKMGYDAGYTAYYKVLIPYYLAHLDSALYLDCDIIVRGDLTPLFHLPGDTFLAAAADGKINRNRPEHVARIIGREGVRAVHRPDVLGVSDLLFSDLKSEGRFSGLVVAVACVCERNDIDTGFNRGDRHAVLGHLTGDRHAQNGPAACKAPQRRARQDTLSRIFDQVCAVISLGEAGEVGNDCRLCLGDLKIVGEIIPRIQLVPGSIIHTQRHTVLTSIRRCTGERRREIGAQIIEDVDARDIGTHCLCFGCNRLTGVGVRKRRFV